MGIRIMFVVMLFVSLDSSLIMFLSFFRVVDGDT